MSYLTVEVEIDHGRIVAREPEKLPETGSGLLTILLPAAPPNGSRQPERGRELPVVPSTGRSITQQEIDDAVDAE